MWLRGQAWRVAKSLDRLKAQIEVYAPRANPPATSTNAWGAIADDEHSSSSDHYPHFYGALGATAVVCARDFPHAPALGLDGHVVTEALRMSRDPRVGYIICDRRITGPNHGWLWEHYSGDDPHDTHFHVSTVHTGLADDTRVWTLPGSGTVSGDDDLDTNQAKQLADVHYTLTTGVYGAEHMRWQSGMTKLDAIASKLGIAQADLDDIQSKVGTLGLTQAQVDSVAQTVAGALSGKVQIDHDAIVNDVKQALREGSAK